MRSEAPSVAEIAERMSVMHPPTRNADNPAAKTLWLFLNSLPPQSTTTGVDRNIFIPTYIQLKKALVKKLSVPCANVKLPVYTSESTTYTTITGTKTVFNVLTPFIPFLAIKKQAIAVRMEMYGENFGSKALMPASIAVSVINEQMRKIPRIIKAYFLNVMFKKQLNVP